MNPREPRIFDEILRRKKEDGKKNKVVNRVASQNEAVKRVTNTRCFDVTTLAFEINFIAVA